MKEVYFVLSAESVVFKYSIEFFKLSQIFFSALWLVKMLKYPSLFCIFLLIHIDLSLSENIPLKSVSLHESYCVPACPLNSQCLNSIYCECRKHYKPMRESGQLLSCQPICDHGCPLHSNCIGYNTCKCVENYEKDNNTYSELNEALCRPICNVTCPENSSCTAPNVCECNTGFKEVRPDGQTIQCHKNHTKLLISTHTIIYSLITFVLIIVIIAVILVALTRMKKKVPKDATSITYSLDSPDAVRIKSSSYDLPVCMND